MLKQVICEAVQLDGEEGLQISFVDDTDRSEAYAFFDKPDIEYINLLIARRPPPEVLMVEIRNKMGITLH